jgi:hypothetical protein
MGLFTNDYSDVEVMIALCPIHIAIWYVRRLLQVPFSFFPCEVTYILYNSGAI